MVPTVWDYYNDEQYVSPKYEVDSYKWREEHHLKRGEGLAQCRIQFYIV